VVADFVRPRPTLVAIEDLVLQVKTLAESKARWRAEALAREAELAEKNKCLCAGLCAGGWPGWPAGIPPPLVECPLHNFAQARELRDRLAKVVSERDVAREERDEARAAADAFMAKAKELDGEGRDFALEKNLRDKIDGLQQERNVAREAATELKTLRHELEDLLRRTALLGASSVPLDTLVAFAKTHGAIAS
jgi:multidrug resistance efflux pump